METHKFNSIRVPNDRCDDPKILFRTLPEAIQKQFHHSANVNMYVSGYIYGKITREEMMSGLAVSLCEQNAVLIKRFDQLIAWFGVPPSIDRL